MFWRTLARPTSGILQVNYLEVSLLGDKEGCCGVRARDRIQLRIPMTMVHGTELEANKGSDLDSFQSAMSGESGIKKRIG